jgi:cytochrome P450
MVYVVILLISFLLLVLYKKFNNNPLWTQLPGPDNKWPFFGVYFDIVGGNISELHSKWALQYGPIMRYCVFGTIRIMISDPAMVKYVLLNNHLFDKDFLPYHALGKLLGKGLVTQTDEKIHKAHKNIILPAFAHRHLRAMVPIFQRKGKLLVEDFQKKAGTGTPITIKDYIAKATADTIGEAAFGYKLNSQRDEAVSSVYNLLTIIAGGELNLFAEFPIIQQFVPIYHKRVRAVNSLQKTVRAIIAQKLETKSNKKWETAQNEEEDNMEERDLLDILIRAQNEEGGILTKEELTDQIRTFLLAGYETSSVCILWTLYTLAKRPDIQQKLAEEIIGVIGKDRAPTPEDIDKMPYLFNVLRESLRFYPPIPYVFRRASQDVELGGHLIPKDTFVMINIYHMHHYSPVWKNPETFDPDRYCLLFVIYFLSFYFVSLSGQFK